MRKIRKLSLFGILGIIIVALVFIGIIFTQAQLKALDKPPWAGPDKNKEEVTWAVELPVKSDGTMLYGDGAMYENNDSNVIIKVEKKSSMVRDNGTRQIVFFYYFCFKLANPTNRYASFQGIDLDYVSNPEEGPSGIFPGDSEPDPTTRMENFLNLHQPYTNNGDNYEYFYLKFQVGQYSFPDYLGPIEGIEDENWGYNDPVKFTSHSDWIKIRVQNQEDFFDPYEEYHNVECDERNYYDGILENMNIWIVKLDTEGYDFHDPTITGCDGVWRICVGTNTYTESSPEDLLFQEQYTQRTVRKGKGGKTETVVPLEATGNFSFYIDFIKNPSTETQ